jgi:hypothetical protein
MAIDIAPIIFAYSKRNNWKVAQALHTDAWVGNTFTIEHLTQFIDL